jgi:NADPH:quinone reductase-like Zn-dependent oxidoreductase
LGATHPIDRKGDVLSEVAKIFTTPPGIVFDAISEDTQSQAWDALGPGGILILVLPAQPEITSGGERGKTALTTFGLIYDDHRDLGRSLFSKLTQLLESGKIKAGVVLLLFLGGDSGDTPNSPAM